MSDDGVRDSVWSRVRHRGLIEVRGEDRVRWLNGMLSNDVAVLDPAGPRSGCYALLLSRQGRILADLHVMARPERLLLELEGAAVGDTLASLEKFVIADDVELADVGERFVHLALEGPQAPALAAEALGTPLAALEADAVEERTACGVPVLRAAYGLAGPEGLQLFAPAEGGEAVVAALAEAAGRLGIAEADAEAFEVRRIEGGAPRLGHDLDDSVLPDEAGLARAVSTTKGCYTGQEVVARLRSRGRVNHQLVGLRFERDGVAPGAPLQADGSSSGEVTSVTRSPRFGAIGLGFVKSEHAGAGTRLDAGGIPARVAPLPFSGAEPPERDADA